jgi:hypothetical protein
MGNQVRQAPLKYPKDAPCRGAQGEPDVAGAPPGGPPQPAMVKPPAGALCAMAIRACDRIESDALARFRIERGCNIVARKILTFVRDEER